MSIGGIRTHHSKQSYSFVLRAAGDYSNKDDSNEPMDTPVAEESMLIIEEDVTKDVVTKEDDPFGIVRLGGSAVMCAVGLAILVNDASKFTPVIGSILTIALDIAFTLAMVGAFSKEWGARQANED
jgi:hypothetical protein